MTMFLEVIKLLGGTAILVGAVAWLIKALFSHWMSKDIENFKNQLQATTAMEIEKLRSQLAQQQLEHEVKYRRIDEKVAEHLTTIYQLLFDLYSGVLSHVRIMEWSDEPSKNEKFQIVIDANKKFWDYFLHNRVYVHPKLYKQINEVAKLLGKTSQDFNNGQEREKAGRPPRSTEEDHWGKASDEIEQKGNPMFTALVAEIQARLGITELIEPQILIKQDTHSEHRISESKDNSGNK